MFGLEWDDGDIIIKVNFKNKYIVLIVNPVLKKYLTLKLIKCINCILF